MSTTTYTILTPHGALEAVWMDSEEQPVEYTGPPEAQAYFSHYLDLRLVTGAGGRRLSMPSLEPSDAFNFCQSREFGIAVLPDPEDMIALLIGARGEEDDFLLGIA